MNNSKTYDYIIIGGGSAGSVLAARLAEQADLKICLIEAGSRDETPRIQTPAGTITLYKSKKFSWNFYSTPQKAWGTANPRPARQGAGWFLIHEQHDLYSRITF